MAFIRIQLHLIRFFFFFFPTQAPFSPQKWATTSIWFFPAWLVWWKWNPFHAAYVVNPGRKGSRVDRRAALVTFSQVSGQNSNATPPFCPHVCARKSLQCEPKQSTNWEKAAEAPLNWFTRLTLYLYYTLSILSDPFQGPIQSSLQRKRRFTTFF